MFLKNNRFSLYLLNLVLIVLPCVFVIALPQLINLGASVSFWYTLPLSEYPSLWLALTFLTIVVMFIVVLLKKIDVVSSAIPLNLYAPHKPISEPKKYLALAAITILFLLNCFRYIHLFPFVLVGEWNTLLEQTDMISGTAPKDWEWLLTSFYNLGFSPIYILLKPIIGSSALAIKTFYIAVWALSIISLCLLLLRKHPISWFGILLFTPVFINSLSLLSLRQYKWHAVAITATAALFFIVEAFQQYRLTNKKQALRNILIGVGLLIAFGFMYHGIIIYIPILLLIISYDIAIDYSRSNKKSGEAVIIFIFFILVFSSILIYYKSDFALRITNALFHNEFDRTIAGNLQSFLAVLFKHGISQPLSVIFIIGLGSSIYRFNESWFARAILITFLMSAAGLSITYGLTVIDENNYMMLSFIGILLLGMLEIYYCLRRLFIQPAYVATACILLSGTLSYIESQHYYLFKNNMIFGDGLISPEGNNVAALSLIDMRNKLSTNKPIALFFPSKKSEFGNGGFEDKEFYMVPYFRDVLNSTYFYNSIIDLQKKIKFFIEKFPDTRIFVYYNPEFDMYTSLSKDTDFTVHKTELIYPDIWSVEITNSYLYVYKGNPDSALLRTPPLFANNKTDDTDMLSKIEQFSRIVNNR